MLYIKNNPVGIDKKIDFIQQNIFKKLCKLWNITEADYNSFCRAYKNQKNSGYVPEFYMGTNEYEELFFDDTVSATSFFVVADKVDLVMSSFKAIVSLVFCVDIPRLRTLQHRADEEIRQDVIGKLQGIVDISSVETGINNVFREFTQTQIKYRDLHPMHCFRINFSLIYNNC